MTNKQSMWNINEEFWNVADKDSAGPAVDFALQPKNKTWDSGTPTPIKVVLAYPSEVKSNKKFAFSWQR